MSPRDLIRSRICCLSNAMIVAPYWGDADQRSALRLSAGAGHGFVVDGNVEFDGQFGLFEGCSGVGDGLGFDAFDEGAEFGSPAGVDFDGQRRVVRVAEDAAFGTGDSVVGLNFCGDGLAEGGGGHGCSVRRSDRPRRFFPGVVMVTPPARSVENSSRSNQSRASRTRMSVTAAMAGQSQTPWCPT